ncbi:MAG: choice-of-anchor I family protein [Proteobacteria bacterium]|nr:choice-of-anchor I family protein [Pseudomonadota bacterium]
MPLAVSPLRAALRAIAIGGASLALLQAPALAVHPQTQVQMQRLWQFAHQPGVPGQKSEIVAYDETTDTLWVAGVRGVDVIDRAAGQRLAHIDVSQFGLVNSVAIHDGLAAFAIENSADRTRPGVVVFFDTRTRRQNGAPLTVGALPDMLTFTPDGRTVLVANEGTPNPRPTAAGLSAEDPAGSVSIIGVRERRVRTVALDPSIPGYQHLRLFPATGSLPTQPATYSAYGPEPEYIAVDKQGRFAYVGLQEANGVAVLDIERGRFDKIYGLGLKDFSLPGNEIDPSDQDGVIRLRNVPVKGLYQPDGIAAYEFRGETYLVMANEGDARDNGEGDGEDERRGSAGNASIEYVPDGSELGRLTFSNVDSARGGPLVAFGGHSMSVRRAQDGELVYDSGSKLDAEAIRLGIYDDGRSDNKGVEPEGVALLRVQGRVLAFVGLERTLKSAVAVFDITDPRDVQYVDMFVSEGDLAVEGLTAFKARGRYYVAIANESTDTTSLFELSMLRGGRAGAGEDD